MQAQTRRDAEKATEALARMLRIKTGEEAQGFAAENPTLFPSTFWTWTIRQVPPGVALSGQPVPQLRNVEFWRAYQGVLWEAWRQKFPADEAIRLLAAPIAQGVDALSALPTHAYQQGIMLLALEPWRCRYCAACGQPFAAKIPADRYCSRVCFESQRRAAKLDWWRRVGSGHRAKHPRTRHKAKGRNGKLNRRVRAA